MEISAILAQMPHGAVTGMTYELDEMALFARDAWVKCGHASREAFPMLTHDARGWAVIIDGTKDPVTARQGGSRGGWPTLRHAILATVLIAHRPELPIRGA